MRAICVNTNARMCKYECVLVWVCVCVSVCVCVYVRVCVCVCVHKDENKRFAITMCEPKQALVQINFEFDLDIFFSNCRSILGYCCTFCFL